MPTLPNEPRVAFLQPGQLIPRAARDALHSFNVSTTAMAILGAVRDARYDDLHFYDIACEHGDLLRDFNENLLYKGAPDDAVAKWLGDLAPDVVLLTSMFTCDFPATDHAISLVRRTLPGTIIIVGGRHASLMPQWHLANDAVDYLVQGEGEQTIVRVLDALSGRIGADPTKFPGVITRDTCSDNQPKAWPEARLGGTFAQDLVLFKGDGSFRYNEVVIDSSPKDHLYKRNAKTYYSFPLMPTRGCPLACRFCGSHFNPDMRPVGSDRMMQDIRWAYEHGVRIFYNISENFCLHEADRTFLQDLADYRSSVAEPFVLTHPNSTFLPVYMKGKLPDAPFIDVHLAAGTDLITISVETLQPRFDDKKLFKKYSIKQVEALWEHFRKVGLKVHLYMMTGFPGQTVTELLADVAQVRDWVERGLIDAASWSNLLYLPGTAYYNQAVDKGWFSEAQFRSWIDTGFNFFAVPERLNFSNVPTPVLQEVLAALRDADYARAMAAPTA
jgi:radical SAM superfamily enzyme YgiQ (UPF0313 family)